MAKFIYNGAFAPTDIGKKSYIFADGNEYDLDEKDKTVEKLVRLGKLIPVTQKDTKKGVK